MGPSGGVGFAASEEAVGGLEFALGRWTLEEAHVGEGEAVFTLGLNPFPEGVGAGLHEGGV